VLKDGGRVLSLLGGGVIGFLMQVSFPARSTWPARGESRRVNQKDVLRRGNICCFLTARRWSFNGLFSMDEGVKKCVLNSSTSLNLCREKRRQI